MDKTSSSDLVKQLSPPGTEHSQPVSVAETAPAASRDAYAESAPSSIEASVPTWGFDHLPAYDATIRGGGCVQSAICDTCVVVESAEEKTPNRAVKLHLEQKEQDQDKKTEHNTEEHAKHKSWPGWAELENDPEIFTILLQEWGVPNVAVNEIIDMAELIIPNSRDILGLIFLSRYVPSDQSSTSGPAHLHAAGGKEAEPRKPWFANQISKFSCGTVALMNILMNARSLCLSETLDTFRQDTSKLDSKHKGIALDNHPHFRDIHNSFSTKLDRMIVDVLVKDDAQKWKQRKAQQARSAAQGGQDGATKKRKRGGRAPFTQRRKRATTADEEDENGFHFVAYLEAHGSVWKLDGMQARPQLVGAIEADQTWLNVAAEDLLQKMENALVSGQECSLMSVAKTNTEGAAQTEAQRVEKERKQEDWAPFIEHMLRLHAEKGDLQEMLGL